MEKNNKNYVILERDKCAGSFFRTYPRHRNLISINKRNVEADLGTDENELKMRHDWNSLISDDPKCRVTEYTKDYFPNVIEDLFIYYNI